MKAINILFLVFLCFPAALRAQDNSGWEKAGILPVGHVYQFYVTTSGDLYAGSFENLFRSKDNGESWVQMKVPPLVLTCFYQYEKGLLIGTEEHGVMMLESTKDEPTFITDESIYDRPEGFLKVRSIVTKGKNIYAAFVSGGSNPRSLIYYKSADDNNKAWSLNSEIPDEQVRSLTLSGNNIIANTNLATFVAKVNNTAFQWNRMTYDGKDIVIRDLVSVGRGEIYGLIDKQGYTNRSPEYKSFYDASQMIKKLWKATNDGDNWNIIFADKDQNLTDLVEINYANDVLYLTAKEPTGFSIFKNGINHIETGAWATEYVGDRYGSSIHISSSGDKFVRPLRGVLKYKTDKYESVNKGLTIINTHNIYANEKYVFALIGHGLYKCPINQTSANKEWVLADDLLPPGSTIDVITWGHITSSKQNEVIVGSHYGIQLSNDGGDTWTDVRGGFGNNVWLTALKASSKHLFAIFEKKTYMLENKAGEWKEIAAGFDAQYALHLQKIGEDIYVIATKYVGAATLIHIYKFDEGTKSWEFQQELKHNGSITNIRSFTASGSYLVFGFTTKDESLFYRFNTTDRIYTALKNPLEKKEGYINHILSINNSIFLAPNKSKNIYVSYDDGNEWALFTDANFSLSGLASQANVVYAAFTGNGIYKRAMAEFFPPKVALNKTNHEKVRASTAQVSGTVTARENFPVNAVFQYSEDKNFIQDVFTKEASSAAIVDVSAVGATLDGMKIGTKYYYRLLGTNSGNVQVSTPIDSFITKSFQQILTAPAPNATVNAVQGAVTEASTQELSLSLKLNQYVPNTVVTLHSRALGSTEVNKKVLNSTTDTYTFELPPDQFDGVGLEYYISVEPPKGFEDPLNIIEYTDTFQVAINHSEGLSLPQKLNIKDREYLLLSIPLVLEKPTVQGVFGDELAVDEANKGKWRMLRYRPAAERSGENGFEWTELVNTSTVEPGKSYWLIATQDAAISKAAGSDQLQLGVGAGKTVAHSLKKDAEGGYYYSEKIPANDWVQIGNPFPMDVSWSAVKAYNAKSSSAISNLISFQKVTDDKTFVRDESDILRKFSGGYVKNTSNTEVELKIPVSAADNEGGRIAQGSRFDSEALLSVNFSLASSDKLCRLSGLGVHEDALEDEDAFDAAVPPSLDGFPTLLHRTEGAAKAFTRSILPLQGEGQSWEFAISAEGGELINIQWQVQNKLGHQLWLRDLSNEHIVNMQLASQYKFTGTRQFKVYWGTEAYIKANLVPDANVLKLYPNPLVGEATISFSLPASDKDYGVRLSVLDLSGRQIHLIRKATYGAGFHETSWDGQINGQSLSKGIYLLELKTDGSSGSSVRYLKFVNN